MSAPAFDTNEIAHYAGLWQRMVILPSRLSAVQLVAHKILGYKDRYLKLEKTTRDRNPDCSGIPWWFIGIIHYRESDCNFHCHLHNGDPLTHRTVQVPAGRPLGEPPFTWEESALDALTIEGFLKVTSWSLERAAYAWEAFNGWGYWRMGVTSAYLLAGTDEHEKGKYTGDHHYDPEAVDQEIGCLPILKVLMALDPSINLAQVGPTGPQSVTPVRSQTPPDTRVAPVSAPSPRPPQGARPKTPWAAAVGTLTSLATSLGHAFDSLRPYLAAPKVVAVLAAVALVAGGVILWEHLRARHG
jgi:lysozyme family protein